MHFVARLALPLLILPLPAACRAPSPSLALGTASALPASQPAHALPYDSMASRIVGALQVSAGERVLLRVDSATMAPLAPAVRSLLEARGAIVDALPYGPAPDFDAQLARTDIYVWLPTRVATPADQSRALERWLDNGQGREVHFHWV